MYKKSFGTTEPLLYELLNMLIGPCCIVCCDQGRSKTKCVHMKKLTKVELLKVFTKIPNEFIDDFYNILSDKSGEFVVNLETVAKWLNVRKDDLHDTLQKSYHKNVDYTHGRVFQAFVYAIAVAQGGGCSYLFH